MANELMEIAIEGESNPDYKYVNEVDWYINPNLNPGKWKLLLKFYELPFYEF